MSKLRTNELESLETGRSLKVDELAQTFDYEAGIKITSYNQMVRDDNGDFWRVSGSVVLPYVTTGSGLPEGDTLVPADDAKVRYDLSNPDKGAAMVARGVVAVDSIADLLALPESSRREDLRYLVKGFYGGHSTGGGEFIWDGGYTKSNANGGTVIDPDNISNYDGTYATLEGYLNAQGSGIGTGCWAILGDPLHLRLELFGLLPDGEIYLPLKKAATYAHNKSNVVIEIPAGVFTLDQSGINEVVNCSNFTMRGAGMYLSEIRATKSLFLNWFPTNNDEKYPHKNISFSDFSFVDYEPEGVQNTWHLDLFHVQNVTFERIRAVNMQTAGHILDFSGSRDLLVQGCVFEGSKASIVERYYPEYIQVAYSSKWSSGSEMAGPYEQFINDQPPSGDITVVGNKFIPFKDEFGNIITKPSRPVGNHGVSGFDMYSDDYLNLTFTGNTVERCTIEDGVYAADPNETRTPLLYLHNYTSVVIHDNSFDLVRGEFADRVFNIRTLKTSIKGNTFNIVNEASLTPTYIFNIPNLADSEYDFSGNHMKLVYDGGRDLDILFGASNNNTLVKIKNNVIELEGNDPIVNGIVTFNSPAANSRKCIFTGNVIKATLGTGVTYAVGFASGTSTDAVLLGHISGNLTEGVRRIVRGIGTKTRSTITDNVIHGASGNIIDAPQSYANGNLVVNKIAAISSSTLSGADTGYVEITD